MSNEIKGLFNGVVLSCLLGSQVAAAVEPAVPVSKYAADKRTYMDYMTPPGHTSVLQFDNGEPVGGVGVVAEDWAHGTFDNYHMGYADGAVTKHSTNAERFQVHYCTLTDVKTGKKAGGAQFEMFMATKNLEYDMEFPIRTSEPGAFLTWDLNGNNEVEEGEPTYKITCPGSAEQPWGEGQPYALHEVLDSDHAYIIRAHLQIKVGGNWDVTMYHHDVFAGRSAIYVPMLGQTIIAVRQNEAFWCIDYDESRHGLCPREGEWQNGVGLTTLYNGRVIADMNARTLVGRSVYYGEGIGTALVDSWYPAAYNYGTTGLVDGLLIDNGGKSAAAAVPMKRGVAQPTLLPSLNGRVVPLPHVMMR